MSDPLQNTRTSGNPAVTVVVAAYNHEPYIRQTLESIENQTFQDFEIILIDDGSTDKTLEIARQCGSRATVLGQANQGVVAARNRGIGLAKGRYICFVDSDDIVLPDRFERQVAVLDKNPAMGLAFADALIIDSTGRQIGRWSDVYPVVPGPTARMLVMHYCFIPMMTALVRRETLLALGPFEEPGPISEYAKWIEIAHVSPVHYDPKPLGCWRRHTGNVSKQVSPEWKNGQTRRMLRRVLRRHPQLQAEVGRGIRKRFARSYFLTAFWLAAEGDIGRARKYYRKAAKVNPFSLVNWLAVLMAWVPLRRFVIGVHRYVRAKRLPW